MQETATSYLGFWYASLSGLFAALASLSAKLAAAAEETLWICESVQESLGYIILDCSTVLLYLRILFLSLVFILNAIMWAVLTKALCICETSIRAILTNTAANLFFTAAFGWLIFNEPLSFCWSIGASLIVVGIALIMSDPEAKESQKIHEKKS